MAPLPCQRVWQFPVLEASWNVLSPEDPVLRQTNAQMCSEASCVPCTGLVVEVTKTLPLEDGGAPGSQAPLVSVCPGASVASGPRNSQALG